MKISIKASSSPVQGLDLIYSQLMGRDIARFEDALQEALLPQKPYLTPIEYSMYRRGKKLRPLLLMLCARMLTGPDGPLADKAVRGAAALEMLHVATLVHDDIIDNAATRRGQPSVNAARGTGTAVIIGDLQFLQSIRAFVEIVDTQKDMGLVQMVLNTAFDICCGELDELRTDPMQSPLELKARYLETIDRKTAILFGLACEAGAALVEAHTSDARRAGFYGRRLGRAFQMMDDIFDFLHSGQQAGKAAGMDLANRRLSLPIVYTIEALGENCLTAQIIHSTGEGPSPVLLERGIQEVISSGAIGRTYADAREQALEAVEYLRPFPQNRYTRALEDIVYYIVNRGL